MTLSLSEIESLLAGRDFFFQGIEVYSNSTAEMNEYRSFYSEKKSSAGYIKSNYREDMLKPN
jgi:hypothetical protein